MIDNSNFTKEYLDSRSTHELITTRNDLIGCAAETLNSATMTLNNDEYDISGRLNQSTKHAQSAYRFLELANTIQEYLDVYRSDYYGG